MKLISPAGSRIYASTVNPIDYTQFEKMVVTYRAGDVNFVFSESSSGGWMDPNLLPSWRPAPRVQGENTCVIDVKDYRAGFIHATVSAFNVEILSIAFI